MKKTIPLKSYFNRGKLFGVVLILILVGIAGYFIYTSFIA